MALSEENVVEIQDLAWKMADQVISADEAQRLEDLLLADADARLLYVQCMQLQADLHLFFNPSAAALPQLTPNGAVSGQPASIATPVAGTPASTPVLKSLPTIGPGSTPTGVQ